MFDTLQAEACRTFACPVSGSLLSGNVDDKLKCIEHAPSPGATTISSAAAPFRAHQTRP